MVLTDPLRRRFLMLNAVGIAGAGGGGHGVGAHTLTHPVLSQLSPEAAWAEISESRCKLEQVIGKPVWALAYPFRGFGLGHRTGAGDGGTRRLQLRIPQRGRRLRRPHAAVCVAAGARDRRNESGRIRGSRFRFLPLIAAAFSGLRLKRSRTTMPLRAHSAQVETKAANLQVYRDPEVVSHYASLDYLTACERLLFDTYLKPGMAILDIGVGGGRTTPYLSQKASRYVGVDYSEEMVRILPATNSPDLEFHGVPMPRTCRHFPMRRLMPSSSPLTDWTTFLPTENAGNACGSAGGCCGREECWCFRRTIRGPFLSGRHGTGSGCALSRGKLVSERRAFLSGNAVGH